MEGGGGKGRSGALALLLWPRGFLILCRTLWPRPCAFCFAWKEFRRQGKGPGEPRVKSEIRGPRGREALVAESHPHPGALAGGRHRIRGLSGRQAASPPTPLLKQRAKKSNWKKKGFYLLLLRVFCLPLKMMLEKKRQGWKGTQRKVRFMPRVKTRFKSQCKSVVNAFGKGHTTTGFWSPACWHC